MRSPARSPVDESDGDTPTLSVAGPPDGAAARPRPLGDVWLVAITAAVSLPLIWLGYGTDIDIGLVRAAGERIRSLDYAPSRNPGVPVVETIVGLLDPVGGHVLVNLATAVALAVTVVATARLVSAWGHDNGDLLALCFLASPVVLISGTQTADFVWAMAFLTSGAVLLVRGRPVPAGVLLALALGSRSSSLLLLSALLLAVGWERERRRDVATTAAVALPLALALYVPAWLSFGRSFEFLDTADGWESLGNNLARFVLKNYAVAGLALIAVVAVALPAMVRALRGWSGDPMLRFAVLGFVGTELLFLRMPWKPAHLVPSLLALVLWIGASARNRRPFLWLVIGAMALNGIVTFRPFVTEAPDTTSGADFRPTITLGWLVNDIRCRAEHMDEPPRVDSGAWACTLEPMRGRTLGAADPLG